MAALAGLVLVSIVGTADYFAWNAAKWRLGERALESGVAAGDVAAGLDWDAHWTYSKNMALLKRRKPLAEIARWDWQVMNSRRSIISFSPRVPPWVQVVDEESYRTPLAPGRNVSIYRVQRPAGEPAKR